MLYFFFAAAPENGTSIELKCQEDPTDWVLDYNDRRAISSLVANCTINGLVDQILHQIYWKKYLVDKFLLFHNTFLPAAKRQGHAEV